jgi:cytochrome c peroxidase
VPPPTTEPPQQPLSPNITWIDPGAKPHGDEVRIEFVHAGSDPEAWGKLPTFWLGPPFSPADQAAALIGLSPLGVAALTAGGKVVRIKVPLGLDDPRPHVPADNPMTLARWELGRLLFHDSSWLQATTAAQPAVSCASCHIPKMGFADRTRPGRDSFRTPTLVNCVFNQRQFWDGRAELLEEVVQRSLQDEREPTAPERFRHVWHGVIGRLRADARLTNEFLKVFGTEPTQDAVGKALAVYLRTILVGNSIHDRAVAEQARTGSRSLEAAHYEAVLTPAALGELGRDKDKPADVAHALVHGYRLFHDVDHTGRTNCAVCHMGRQFTDGGFYNVGIEPTPNIGEERGRFTMVPIGQKDRFLINAFKTPTLRGLLRAARYLHDASADELRDVVAHHAHDREYLDPLMRDAKGNIRGDDLSEGEVADLVLFLRSLNGEEPAPILSKPPSAR